MRQEHMGTVRGELYEGTIIGHCYLFDFETCMLSSISAFNILST
jgi:hypothetical protein